MPETGIRTRRSVPAAGVLFMSLFAAQATLFVLPPILPRLAAEFAVPVAAAGQVRAITGLVAGATPFLLRLVPHPLVLKDVITTGLGVVAAGSLAAALAPDFPVFAAAHALIGVGLGLVLTAGLAAPAVWASPAERARTVSWALMGPPTAAILVTPAAGLLADLDWRLAWLAAPFAASIVAAAAVRTHPAGDRLVLTQLPLRALLRRPELASWVAGEFLAYSAWSGVTVYAGALLIRSYLVAPAVAALAIAASAAAFLAGNRLTRRWLEVGPRPMLLVLALALSATAAAWGAVRPDVWTSAALLVALGLLAGARTLVGSMFGLQTAGRHSVAVMGVRTTAQQYGYLVGAALGGTAISIGGYRGLGAVMSILFFLAAAPHARAAWRTCRIQKPDTDHEGGPHVDHHPPEQDGGPRRGGVVSRAGGL